MKVVLTKLAVICAVVSLAGCSTNTQNQNTGIGAVTGGAIGGLAGAAVGGGAAIGVGLVAGALVGGIIGHSMDSTDNVQVYQSVKSGKSTTWVNTKTGTRYKVTPRGRYMTVNGNHHCREFSTVAYYTNGETQKSYSIACRQMDGSWKTVSR